MSTKHTPGPWEWSISQFKSPPFEGTLEDECGIYPPLGEAGPVAIAHGEANAARIVACVNALEGIDEPGQWVAMAKQHIVASERLLEARMKAVKVLRDLAVFCADFRDGYPERAERYERAYRAAIDEVREFLPDFDPQLDWGAHIVKLTEERDQLRAALKELVDLKSMKDEAKPENLSKYMGRKVAAWDAARQLVSRP